MSIKTAHRIVSQSFKYLVDGGPRETPGEHKGTGSLQAILAARLQPQCSDGSLLGSMISVCEMKTRYRANHT